MNKDVIYIEPEDDITDILTKMQKASQKVVALVPPQKNSILRSAVNVKLINKTARSASKAAVFVTIDPSIIKLAAASQIPVAKDLRSRPEIPTVEDVKGAQKKEEVIHEEPVAKDQKDQPASDNSSKSAAKSDNKDARPTKEKTTKDKKSAKDSKSKDGKKVPSIKKTRRIIIIASIAAVVLIAALIWAIFIAPAVKIVLTVKTTSNDFSENASFVTTESNADISKGRLYLEQKKLEQPASVKFQATGQQDKGNKASGSLTVSTVFHGAGTITIPAGGTFTYNGNSYTVNAAATISWNGTDDSQCDPGSGIAAGCYRHTTVGVTAAEAGTKYNVDAKDSGWTANIGDVSVSSASAMSGGTSNIVTIVQQSDVDKARESLGTSNDESKTTLSKQFKDDYIVINDSFNADTPNPVAKPAVGEEVPSGTQPTLSSTATFTLSGIKKNDLKDFVKHKSNLGDDQEIYSLGDPFFDRFSESSNGMYSARIKTNYHVGPAISEDSLREKAKGKKFGDVKTALLSVNGVKDVDFKPSVFWVFSVPNDDSKVQIEINIEDAK